MTEWTFSRDKPLVYITLLIHPILMKYGILLFILTSCVNSGNTETKSSLEHLNGKNYGDSTNYGYQVQGVLFTSLNKQGRETTVTGALFLKTDIMLSPLNNEKIQLLNQKNQVIATVSSSHGGQFKFFQKLINGNYQLKLSSKKYNGSLNFEVKSYEVKDLKLIVHPINQ